MSPMPVDMADRWADRREPVRVKSNGTVGHLSLS
jgi:hypothetical protein